MSLHPSALTAHVHLIARLHPWYGKLLEEKRSSERGHLDYADNREKTLLSLNELPLLNADLLARHYYAEPPRSEAGLSVYRTSGTSSGIRKSIYYSPEDDLHYIAAKQTSFEAWLNAGPIRRALADLGTGHAASTALSIFSSMGMEGEAISFSAPIEEHVAKLRSYRPELLYTMPSLLESIADAWPKDEPFPVRKVILVGEIASREWQANMAARLCLTPSDLLDTYGSIEVGAIAAYSHERNRYVLSEGMWGEGLTVQELGESFEPLADNERVLVLTSPSRLMFPVVRFVTYDVVRDFEVTLIDGVPRGTFTGISKRIGSELKHGEKISLYDIEAAVHLVLTDAAVRVAVNGNRLMLHIRSDQLAEHPEKLRHVRNEVEQRIPDIGMMIRGGLLKGIDVIPVDAFRQLPGHGSVKGKKIYPS
jgi:phenylacetate-CoA ligase